MIRLREHEFTFGISKPKENFYDGESVKKNKDYKESENRSTTGFKTEAQ